MSIPDASDRFVVLHAGLPKTGSSSIQAALWAGRDVLADAGVHYWSVAENHSWPLSLMFASDTDRVRDGAFKVRRFGTPAAIRASLQAELAGDWRVFIVSAERISGLRMPDLTALRDMAAATGAAIRAVAYVREPRGWATSIVQQRLKVGDTCADTLARYAELPYRERLERMLALFGDDLDVRLFRRDWGPGGIHGDFLRTIGDDGGLAARIPEVRRNSSMPAPQAQLLDRINAEMRRLGEPYRTTLSPRRYMHGLFDGPRFRLDDATMDAWLDANREQIAWVEQVMGRPFPPGERSDGSSPDGTRPIDPDMVALVARLLVRISQLKEAWRGGSMPEEPDLLEDDDD